jgi:hypothetical protein
LRDNYHHNYDCSPRNMSSCDCSSRDRCCSTNTCGCYGGHEGHQDNWSMNKRHHHRPCNYDCSPRNISSCDCSSRDRCCSTNTCGCGHEGHQDKQEMKLKKGARFMLEKAFYKALMEDQVERIKDMFLDDEEMDETLEETANLITKVMKKQWQEGFSKSEVSEELDHELEKIFQRMKRMKEEADEDIKDTDEEEENEKDIEDDDEEESDMNEDEGDEKRKE